MSIRATLNSIAERGEKAVGLFLTCGFPNPDATVEILDTIAEAGSDFVELGMPFSDRFGSEEEIFSSHLLTPDYMYFYIYRH